MFFIEPVLNFLQAMLKKHNPNSKEVNFRNVNIFILLLIILIFVSEKELTSWCFIWNKYNNTVVDGFESDLH